MPDSALPSSPQQGLFPTTHWSMVGRAGGGSPAEMHAALADLCREYWYPIYAYVRRRGHSPHDAQDLTQAFIVDLIEGPMLARADREKGRFRSFVIGSLRNFLANENRRQNTQRRGGLAEVVSLDRDEDEARFTCEQTSELNPDEHFERNWAFALLDHVLARLGAEYETAGRAPLFAALQPYLAGRSGQDDYATIGAALGLKENTVAVSVLRMRRRYGELLREEIARTVASPEEVDEEIAHLLAVVAG